MKPTLNPNQAATALRYLEPILAAQGDRADPELVAAQHALAEIACSPANANAGR